MNKLVKTKINHQIADEETEKQIWLPGVRTKETYIFLQIHRKKINKWMFLQRASMLDHPNSPYVNDVGFHHEETKKAKGLVWVICLSAEAFILRNLLENLRLNTLLKGVMRIGWDKLTKKCPGGISS